MRTKTPKIRRGHALIKVLGIAVLAFIMLVGITGAAPYAYITNSGDNTVSVIDTATNTVTATVPVGTGPYGVAVTPDGKKVYVMCPEDDCGAIDPGSFYVIGTSTNTVIAKVPEGGAYGGPVGVAVSPDGTKVYATTYAGVTIIDTATNTVTAGLGPGFMLRGVAFNPAGTKAYVAAMDYPGDVRVIDTATNTVTGLSLALDSYCAVAVSPDGTKVYVTNDVGVIVIDTATNTVTATVSVGSNPYGIAVTPDGTRVYATNSGSSTVSVIDTTTNTVAATVPVGNNPVGVSVTPDGTRVYVANSGSDTVSVIDTATNTVIATVPVGKCPIAFGQFIGDIPVVLPDTDSPVIESVILFPTSTTTGSTINVTVNVTDNVGVSGVKANDIPLLNQVGSLWNGSITAIEGIHFVNVSAVDEAGNVAWDNSTSYTALTQDSLPPSSITNLQSTTGNTWVNWTWQNPTDPDFNHTEIYLNGTFQTNTSAEYFNATGLQPETDYTIGTRTVDINGNINETWVNASAKTGSLPDTDSPVIESVILFPTSTTTGSTINVTVNVTDNVGVSSVKANDVSLLNQGGSLWNGSIIAIEGTHFVNVSAVDETGNVAVYDSASYTATTPDTEAPVINSVSLSSSTPETGDSIVVTVDVTDNVGVSSVAASGVALVNTGGNVWEGSIVAEEGTHTVSVTTVDEAGNVTLDNSTSYTALTPYNLPHSSITNLQSTTGNNWVNWTWKNPTFPDFNHTEIYLNGTFQTNTSAEYFNATDLEPETSYNIGTRTVDINGNVNETWVNATAITKEKDSSVISDPGSDGSSSGGSGGSGSSGGAFSLEPAKNVEVKELSQQFITNGKPVKFLFPKNVTCITYVEFDSKRTLGKITTIVEMLKGKSAIVSELPEGKVYKNMNIWVGNRGTASPKNIENAVVGFKVEKSWVAGGVDESSIALYRYSDKAWGELVTRKAGEDDKYLYFEAETPGFSPFSIVAPGVDSLNEKEENKSPSSVEGSYRGNIEMNGNKSSEGGITELESAEKGSETGSKSKILILIGLLSISLLVVYMVLRKQS